MGAINLNFCGKLTRVLFIILNLLFFVIGIAVIAGGIYLIVNGSTLQFFTGNRIVSGAAIVIICGVVTAVVSGIGLLGAFGLWRVLLGIYAFAVLIIVLLEIVAGILGFVYRDTLRAILDERAAAAITQYAVNGTGGGANPAVDFMQERFECCGWDNITDWTNTTYYRETRQLPPSCNCMSTGEGSAAGDECQTFGSSEVYARACRASVENFFRRNLLAIGGIGIAIGFFEVVGIVLGCILLVAVNKAHNYTEV